MAGGVEWEGERGMVYRGVWDGLGGRGCYVMRVCYEIMWWVGGWLFDVCMLCVV